MEKTPDNFNYGNMTADFRMRYKKMMEEKEKKRQQKLQEKANKKAQQKASKQQQIADKLYGRSE